MTAFGRYELLRRVGSGGMADIWKARVAAPGGMQSSVAIKRILPDLVENREFLRMFADEAKLVSTLQHPNVVQVMEFGHVGKHDYYMAMEYVAGVNLARLLNRAFETSRLPPELALYVVFETTRGLGHAHTRPSPVVHRDVSPQNVLLSFKGDVKITDFGIARVQTAIPRTAVGHVRGKVAYMSPEQAAADPSRPVDVRSDLFSLGIILYEMMTGRRLFPGGSSVENHARVITFRGPSEEELSHIPPALREIVATALQGNPDDRFQSAEALEDALTAALGDDVFAQGKQFLASYLPRLFPDEFEAEKKEDAELAPKTNVQLSLADVDGEDDGPTKSREGPAMAPPPRRAGPPEPVPAVPPPPPPATLRRRPLPPRRRDEVSVDGGMVPEPVERGSRGDTVISPRNPDELSMPKIPEPSVSVTVASEDLEHTRVRDEESEFEPGDLAPVELAGAPSKSGLTLAPPAPVPVMTSLPEPVEWAPQEPSVATSAAEPRRTSARTSFDEPLFPPRPEPPKWLAPALIGGGILLGAMVPLLVLVVFLFWGGDDDAANATPKPTPFALSSTSTPTAAPRETPTAVPERTPDAPEATPVPTPEDAIDELPIVGDTPPPATAAPTPVRTAVSVRTPRPTATPRATPVAAPTENAFSFEEPAVTGGRLIVDASTACDIFIDRGKTPHSPPFERELSPGKHVIGVVHKPSGLWLEQSYEVPAGGSLKLYVDVEQATMKVR